MDTATPIRLFKRSFPREKLTEIKQNKDIKESTNYILLSSPGNGQNASLPKSWSSLDLHVRGTGDEMESQLRVGAMALQPLAALEPWTCCHSLTNLLLRGLASWAEGESRASTPRVGSDTDLRLTLLPTRKDLSGKTVSEYHDFHSSWRSTEFWDSQHQFLSSSGSE